MLLSHSFSTSKEALMRLLKKVALIFFSLSSLAAAAQVSPFQIPPKWMFGLRAGFDFGTSPYTISPPNALTGNPSYIYGMEASTAACDPTSALVFYSDAYRYYDYPANATSTFPGAITPGYGSATNGCVAVPDPASPATRFYLFVANDRTSGFTAQGINYYVFTKAGASVTVTGPNNLCASNVVDEALGAGSDGNGGYWVVAHNYNDARYMIWHVTTGGVVASTQTPPGSPINGIGVNAATIKFNRCQDRIAYCAGSNVQVHAWDRTTGTVGAQLYRQSGIGNTIYGLEFSPSGRFLYFTELYGGLKQIDLTTPAGAPANIAAGSSNQVAEMGTMQLGPDNKIYVTNCNTIADANYTGAIYVGVINTPDGGVGAACGYSGTGYVLKPNNGATFPSISRGIANMAWMSPELPSITISAGGSCTEKVHTINFETYFNTPITLTSSPATSIQWSFDNGVTWVNGNGTNTFTYNYGGSVTTTVRARFYDQVCNNFQWTASEPINISCPMPVEFIDFTAEKSGHDVLLNWYTAHEIDNSHFVIEHSADGVNFSSIGTVQGHGTTSIQQAYSLIDYNPYSGMNYYRLVQYDFNGKKRYSKIVSVYMEGLLVNVFPNPSSSDFTVQISGGEEGNIVITDMLGRELYRNELQNESETLTIGEDFPEGTYIIQVITTDDAETVKVIKN